MVLAATKSCHNKELKTRLYWLQQWINSYSKKVAYHFFTLKTNKRVISRNVIFNVSLDMEMGKHYT